MWLLTIAVGVFCSVIAAELLDVCPWLTEKLLRRALQRVPPGCRERYTSEWLADQEQLRSRCGKFTMLCWAFGVFASSRRLATELGEGLKRRRRTISKVSERRNAQMSLFPDDLLLARHDRKDFGLIENSSFQPPSEEECLRISGRKGTAKLAIYTAYTLDHAHRDVERSIRAIRVLKKWRDR